MPQIQENIKKDRYEKWVREPVSYEKIVPKIEELVERNFKLDQEIHKLALSVSNANSDNNLSNSLCSVARYYRFRTGKPDINLDIAVDCYIKSLELVDLENLDRYNKGHNQIGWTLLSLADIYLKQGKIEQAKDFYIECFLYNQNPYADKALETLASLGNYKIPKPFYKQKSTRVLIGLVTLIFFPFIYKLISFLPIVPIIITVIIIGAIFNRELTRWAISYGKGKPSRNTLNNVKKLTNKWNIS